MFSAGRRSGIRLAAENKMRAGAIPRIRTRRGFLRIRSRRTTCSPGRPRRRCRFWHWLQGLFPAVLQAEPQSCLRIPKNSLILAKAPPRRMLFWSFLSYDPPFFRDTPGGKSETAGHKYMMGLRSQDLGSSPGPRVSLIFNFLFNTSQRISFHERSITETAYIHAYETSFNSYVFLRNRCFT